MKCGIVRVVGESTEKNGWAVSPALVRYVALTEIRRLLDGVSRLTLLYFDAACTHTGSLAVHRIQCLDWLANVPLDTTHTHTYMTHTSHQHRMTIRYATESSDIVPNIGNDTKRNRPAWLDKRYKPVATDEAPVEK